MAFCYRLDYTVDASPSNGLRRLAFKKRVNVYVFRNRFDKELPTCGKYSQKCKTYGIVCGDGNGCIVATDSKTAMIGDYRQTCFLFKRLHNTREMFRNMIFSHREERFLLSLEADAVTPSWRRELASSCTVKNK
jgi:hypothetical protein